MNTKETLKLLPIIYQDLAQPTVQKFGTAISSLVGIITGPIITGSEIAEKNLKKLVERLNEEDGEILPVPPELGIPILDRLRYTTGEELVSLYTELFVKASLKESQNSTHPSYFEIITNLSVDEAKILDYVASDITDTTEVIPYLRIKSESREGKGYFIYLKYFTVLSKLIKFFTPENENMYFENLVRLGILDDMVTQCLADNVHYEQLLTDPILEKWKASVEQDYVFSTEKSYFQITNFGKNFIKTCVPKS